jgi:hypothetical protein
VHGDGRAGAVVEAKAHGWEEPGSRCGGRRDECSDGQGVGAGASPLADAGEAKLAKRPYSRATSSGIVKKSMLLITIRLFVFLATSTSPLLVRHMPVLAFDRVSLTPWFVQSGATNLSCRGQCENRTCFPDHLPALWAVISASNLFARNCSIG